MRFKLLGRTGLRVSELALGTMTFGNVRGWGAEEAESRALFDRFVEAGGNFFDTANSYQDGESERMLGRFMGDRRNEYVVGTKYSLAGRPHDPNSSGNHRKSMVQAIDASLKRLNTDYIDLYWMHAWDGVTSAEEVMRGFDDLVRAGKILHIGLSDTPAWVVSRSHAIAELRGWTSLAAIQLNYNLVERTAERELLPMAEALGLTVTVWGALASGLLSGKYSPEAPGEGRLTAPGFAGRGMNERNFEIIRLLGAIAAANGASHSQVALAWLRARHPMLLPIIGARAPAQLDDNLECLSLKLSAEDLEKLEEIGRPDLGFPTGFLKTAPIQKLLFGETRPLLDSDSVY